MTQRRMRSARAASEVEELPEPARPSLHLAKPGDPVVDLVHHVPRRRADPELLRQGLRFAFESGDAGGLFERSVQEAPTADSGWEAENFAPHLYLEELVGRCFPIRVGDRTYAPSESYLIRLLSQPPADRRDAELRQSVLRELDGSPVLTEHLASIYDALRQLRALLDERPIAYGETVRRKLELLAALRTIIDETADGFGEATSALRRLHDFGTAARANPAYERLLQLLDFDEHLATVQVRLRLGADGRIRDAQLAEVNENLANPMVPTAFQRFWARVVAFFSGYRYGENEVLLRIIDDVFHDLEDVVLPCFALIGDVELYLASLGFRDLARAHGLEVCLPTLAEAPAIGDPSATGPRKLTGLFNPLLFLQDVTPVPCDIDVDRHDDMVVITGPNSGGKTRLLQGLGLAHLLGQSGLFVPAREANITRAPTLFVSLVDRAPAEQKEGRLGTELLRVRALFEQLEPGSLVILDELCSGTNPSEGVAIFEMVIGLLPRLRPQVWVTTHFLDAAERLARERPIDHLAFLQVELDEREEPTYGFVEGVATTSLAQQVAGRLGVTHEELARLVNQRLEAAGQAPEAEERVSTEPADRPAAE